MNAIPIVGWLFSFVVNVCLSIPFWLIWTACGIGRNFFPFLPEPLQAPGFWAVVGIFICLEILRGRIFGINVVPIESYKKSD
ncbi:MAG: hypothetical protein F4X56_10515 [Gammaproteobacteria bacterium]|nr:hypothetical protein [Gammaproteobacteria bacterium]MXW07380.1 hypothetical protein [Gammaproteobacteria bacterium]MYC26330.1 hypothetical protein [Gammaproteobacteria bacterium]